MDCRYVFDPVDVQAEMEVTVRVRKAAAEALTEANEKLRAAEDAQRSLQQKLEAAQDLEQVSACQSLLPRQTPEMCHSSPQLLQVHL